MDTCELCRQQSDIVEYRAVLDVGKVCEPCIASDCATLHDGDICMLDDAVWIEHLGEFYHSSEVWQCDNCGDWYTDANDSSHDSNRGMICASCRDSSYVFTDDTEQYTHIHDAHYCENNDEYYGDCDNMPPDMVDGIYSYDTDIFDVKGRYAYSNNSRIGIFGKRLLYGIELEITGREYYSAYSAADAFERGSMEHYAILKQDGSLDDGFEIVTLPADLDSHKNTFKWDELCADMREAGMQGHYGHNNGLHIHANRAAISPLTLGKILVFMNLPSNALFIQTIAQRDFNSWCEIYPGEYDKVGKSGKNGNMSGKYSAVNVLRNTVEFRIFKATLLSERLFKNLEFVDALIRWCKTEASARNLDCYAFRTYVRKYSKIYPNLNQFISERFESNENRDAA